ncbi:MAG: transglycosylase domain-containing protein [Candidatus Saccharimonadales bacterium]
MSTPRKSSGGRRSISKNQYTTKSGNVIKIHRNLTERWVARKDAAERRKAERMSGLPQSRVKRFLYHFQPKRMYHYWFSRDGGIMALKIVGVGLVVMFLLLVGVFAYFRKDLPKLNDVYGSNIGGSIRYYDRSGKTLLWEDYDAVKRIPVKTDQISPYVRDATVAVEDKDFFKHGGFDVRGIVRAGLNDVLHKGSTQGGSTITQQLVKLSQNWSGQRTLTRKAKEVILAVELEREYSKQDILTGYLNTAPYGNIEYGVEAASRDYFQKSAKDLTLDEAAFLAAIPKSPAVYSPYGPYYDSKSLVGRQEYILGLMADQGYITRAQADAAKKVKILAKIHHQQTKYAGIKAPWFVLAAKTQLEQEYGTQTVNRGGWKVITTLDLKLQNKAEQLVRSNYSNVSNYGADEEAMVGEDVTNGQIVSLVGGTDFTNKDHGQNNFGAGILLPPGSSFKPYDYTTLIENHTNVGAGSVLYDSVGPLPGYSCTNKGLPPPRGSGNCLQDYDFYQPGPLTLRYALGGSRNIPAVKAMLSAVPNDTSAGKVDSINKTISTASAMMYNPRVSGNTYNCYGDEALTQTTQCYGASAIGDGAFLHLDDHVNGLGTLARLGKAIPHTYIVSITDSANKNVKLISYPAKQPIRPDTAYIVDDMASDPNASYLPGSFKFQHQPNGWHFAVKTGTTNNGYDGLMTSWSPKYAVVSWVGNHTRHVELRTAMEYLTEPLTRGWMEYAHKDLKPVLWQKPSGVKSAPAFVVRNHIHYGDIEPSPSNDLYPSWYTGNSNKASSNKPIDIVSNKLATSCTPSLATKTGGNSNSNSFSIDIFVNGGNGLSANTNASDDIHNCSDTRPSINSLTFNGLSGSSTCDSPCTITASISGGTHPLTDAKYSNISGSGTVTLIIDGRAVQTKGASDNITFHYSGSGTHDVKVRVIDSVLYDTTSDGTSVDFGSVNNGDVTGVNGSFSGNNLTVTWIGTATDDFAVQVTGPRTGVCAASNSLSCVVHLGMGTPPGNYSITVTDTNSTKSGTGTASK